MELRRLDPNAQIIAISGGGRMKPELSLQIAKRLGARAALKKPFEIQEMLDTVAQVLGATEGV
jgi:FixJ family two-component response regulator